MFFFKENVVFLSNLFIIILIIFFFNAEYKFSPDVDKNIKIASKFISDDFNFNILFKNLISQRSIEANVFISIFIYSIGILINNIPLIFFILNFSITVFLFYLIKIDLERNKVNKFYFHLFCYLYLLNPDLRLWQSFLLLDYFFTVLIFVYFRFLIERKFISSVIILFLLMFIRPTSIFILPITFLFFLFNYFFKARNNIQIYFLILSAILAFVLFSFLFTSFDDLDFFGPKFNFYKDFNISGIVIHDRWSVSFEINNFYNLFTLLIIKFFAFHQFLCSDFSIIHNIYNLIYYAPYLIVIFLIFKKIYVNNHLNFNKYYLLSFYFFIIYSVCHSILLIDFDWRYRMPLYIPFIISIVYFLYEFKFDIYLKKKIR